MKKLILGLGIMVAGLACNVASANDYYQGDCCSPSTCEPCCGSDFDGFYFGGNLGVATNTSFRSDFDGYTDGGCCTFVDTDFTIGLQLGYDWNCGCSLFGLVFDWNWVNVDRGHHGFNDDRHRHDLDWFLTLRARAGVTVCDCLFYLTAGAAAISHDHRWYSSDFDNTHRHCDTQWGWTGGTGVEYLLGCNWSVGAEILFMHFDNDTSTHHETSQSFRFAHAESIWVGRILLNYRFGDLCGCFCR